MRRIIIGVLGAALLIGQAVAGWGFVGPKGTGAQEGEALPGAVQPPSNQCSNCGKSKVVNEGGRTYIVKPDGTKIEVKLK